jgi:chitodextrinase
LNEVDQFRTLFHPCFTAILLHSLSLYIIRRSKKVNFRKKWFLTLLSLVVVSVMLPACDSGGAGPNKLPTADFDFAPENPRAGTAVTFTSNARDPDGSIEEYEWSTSDGAEGQGERFEHDFPARGSYSVTLKVTDNRGGTSSSSETIEVRFREPNENPEVDFSFSPENPRAGTEVTFTEDARDPDGSIEEYQWSVSNGDGESIDGGRGETFDFAFPQQGTFTVSLEVTDDRDGTSSTSQPIEVRQQFTEVTITQIEVQEMPFANDNGAGWDFASGPDVYVTRFNVPEDARVNRTSTRYDDVASEDLPLSYSTSFAIGDLSEEQSINLIDSDPNADDFIGGVSYTFDELIGEYPNDFTLQFEDIEYDLTLEWSN